MLVRLFSRHVCADSFGHCWGNILVDTRCINWWCWSGEGKRCFCMPRQGLTCVCELLTLDISYFGGKFRFGWWEHHMLVIEICNGWGDKCHSLVVGSCAMVCQWDDSRLSDLNRGFLLRDFVGGSFCASIVYRFFSEENLGRPPWQLVPASLLPGLEGKKGVLCQSKCSKISTRCGRCYRLKSCRETKWQISIFAEEQATRYHTVGLMAELDKKDSDSA
jgi:hypothetical protein